MTVTKNTFRMTIALMSAGIFLLAGCAGFLMTKRSIERITPENLKGLLDNGAAIIIVDVRSLNAFKKQHIAGAISIPLKEIESRLDELPREQEIVFYCT